MSAPSALECLINREEITQSQQKYIESLVRCHPVEGEEPVILSIPNRDHDRFQKQRYALIYENSINLMKGHSILEEKEIKTLLNIE